MKVAYCIREDYKERGGGDVVQLLMTKKYIEKYFKEVRIDVITNPEQLSQEYDLCHIFNYSMFAEAELFFKKALSQKVKIASSPIYWDYSITAYQYFTKIYFFKLNKSILSFEIKLLKLLQKIYPIFTLTSKRFAKYCNFFMEKSDIILPNSIEEFRLLLKFVNKKDGVNYPYEIIYNATTTGEIKLSNDFFYKYRLPKDYLLQVGRIEPVKNQLSVVKALFHNNSIPIVFLGKNFDTTYYNHLKKLSDKRGNVFFIEEVPHEDVFSFYKNAHSHILPSLRESPGLVSLEAYSQGCNIICSQFPYSPFQTYFSGVAIPIDPLDLKSIKRGVYESYQKGKTKKDIRKIEEFTWDNAAKSTYSAYLKVLNT